MDDETRKAIALNSRTLFASELKDGERIVWRRFRAGADDVDEETFRALLTTLPSQYTRFNLNGRLATYDDMLEYIGGIR